MDGCGHNNEELRKNPESSQKSDRYVVVIVAELRKHIVEEVFFLEGLLRSSSSIYSGAHTYIHTYDTYILHHHRSLLYLINY